MQGCVTWAPVHVLGALCINGILPMLVPNLTNVTERAGHVMTLTPNEWTLHVPGLSFTNRVYLSLGRLSMIFSRPIPWFPQM